MKDEFFVYLFPAFVQSINSWKGDKKNHPSSLVKLIDNKGPIFLSLVASFRLQIALSDHEATNCIQSKNDCISPTRFSQFSYKFEVFKYESKYAARFFSHSDYSGLEFSHLAKLWLNCRKNDSGSKQTIKSLAMASRNGSF